MSKSTNRGSVVGRRVCRLRVVLSMSTGVASTAVVVMHGTACARPRGVVGTVHCGPAAHLVDLALLEQGVVFVPVRAGCSGAHAAATARAEVVLVLLEVMGGVGRKGSLGLGGKGRVGDGIGEGAGATEVHDVAEGHPSGNPEKNARSSLDVSDATPPVPPE